jgi:hypothetical protein
MDPVLTRNWKMDNLKWMYSWKPSEQIDAMNLDKMDGDRRGYHGFI